MQICFTAKDKHKFLLHLASALLTNFIFYQGSGKTLAFGIPILTHILSQKATQETDKVIKSDEENGITETSPVADIKSTSSDEINRSLLALIMTPTRELALQIKSHLQQVAKHTSLEVQKLYLTALLLNVLPENVWSLKKFCLPFQ